MRLKIKTGRLRNSMSSYKACRRNYRKRLLNSKMNKRTLRSTKNFMKSTKLKMLDCRFN